MSPIRRLLFVLGLLLLIASLCLLVVANLPNERVQDSQPLPPEDLTLPTPQAFAPLPARWARFHSPALVTLAVS